MRREGRDRVKPFSASVLVSRKSYSWPCSDSRGNWQGWIGLWTQLRAQTFFTLCGLVLCTAVRGVSRIRTESTMCFIVDKYSQSVRKI